MAQLANNLFGRAVIVFLMLAIIKLEQPANALTPTVVVVAGISILANFLQFSKALSPIDYTAVKVTDGKFSQSLKAFLPIVFIVVGNVKVYNNLQPSKTLIGIYYIFVAEIVTDFKAVQPLNELSPNVAIDAGRVIVSKAVQPSKALFDNKVIVLVP